MITFDGTDIDEKGEWLATPYINVWDNPRNEIVATVAHGSTGELLEHKGNRCKVQVGDNIGYVTFWFIKELKLEGRR